MTTRTYLPLLLSVAALTGCQTLSAYHTARPIESGETEWTLTQTAHVQPGDVQATLTPALRVRRGLTDKVDVGLNAIAFDLAPEGSDAALVASAAVDVNVLMVDLGWTAFSLDPAVSASYVLGPTPDLYGTAHVNVLWDVLSTKPLTLTVGVRPGFVWAVADEPVAGLLMPVEAGPMAGAMVGAKLSLGGISVMPEIDVTYGLEGGTMYSAGVAVMF